MKSIRFFLIIVILATITLMAFISALNGYRDSMEKAEQLFDTQLVDKAHLLAMTYTSRSDEVLSNQAQESSDTKAINPLNSPKTPQDAIDVFAFQIWQNDKLLLHSHYAPITPIAHFEEGFHYNNFSNHRWRIYSYHHPRSKLWFFIAEQADMRYVLAENIILESVLPVVFMLPVLGILIWMIISYALSPLTRLAKELGNKRADDLSPLAIEKQPVELIQLVNSTNDLFYRLKASFHREKRFASDAAHELRTPISAIKIHLHNLSELEPGDSVENEKCLQQLKLSVNRMEHLVEQILNLNRISPEQYTSHFRTLNLQSLAQEVIAREYPQFDKKQIQLELEGSPCFIEGDQFALDVLLQNLLTNACKYTQEGGSVLVSVLTDPVNKPSKIVLKIEDSGPGVPKEQYARLFDRFYRLDGDCHASGTIGCGLGLAIVQQIVELHSADIILEKSASLGGLSVNIEFTLVSKKIVKKT